MCNKSFPFLFPNPNLKLSIVKSSPLYLASLSIVPSAPKLFELGAHIKSWVFDPLMSSGDLLSLRESNVTCGAGWPAYTRLWAALHNMRFELEQDRKQLYPEEEPSTPSLGFPLVSAACLGLHHQPADSVSRSIQRPSSTLPLHYPVLSPIYAFAVSSSFIFHHRSVVHCTLLYIKENILITIIQTCWFVIVPREPYHSRNYRISFVEFKS